MNKRTSNILVVLLIAALSGWLVYKYFIAKNDSIENKEAKYFSPNSCWIYHEYVYRVDFDDENAGSFFFIRNDDGTFSPSRSDSLGNLVTGNGFIINTAGACVATSKLVEPWALDDGGEILLKELIDRWLELQNEALNKNYRISGQTVAMFVILSDPEEYIEYVANGDLVKQDQFGIIYPKKRTNITGIQTDYQYKGEPDYETPASWFVVKTNFDDNNAALPFARTTTDHIRATLSRDGYLGDITIKKGDEFFNEGSSLLNVSGQWMGLLHYKDKRWQLVSAFTMNPILPGYEANQMPEVWNYQLSPPKWVRIIKGATTDSGVIIGEHKKVPIDKVVKETENRKDDDIYEGLGDVNIPFKKEEGWQMLEEIDNLKTNPDQLSSTEKNNRSTHSFVFQGEPGRFRIKVYSQKSGLDMTVTIFLMKENKETGLFLVKKFRRIAEQGYVGEYLENLDGTYYAAFDCDPLTEKVRLVFEKKEN